MTVLITLQTVSSHSFFIQQIPMASFDVTPICLLNTNQRDVTIKILIVRQGGQRSTNYDSKSIRKLIFVDEQGTKIHGIIFANAIEHFQDELKINQSYFISNPAITESNQNYPNVNQQFELVLHKDTIVIETETCLESFKVKSDFKEFSALKKGFKNGHEIDIIGILKKVKQICRFERTDKRIGYRRDVILINTLLETITITLWDDLALNEGQHLHETELIHPVVAFSNVKIHVYQGEIQLTSTTTSGMFLHPFCDETQIFNSWLHTHVDEQSLEEIWMTKRIKDSEEVTLAQLLNKRHTLQKSMYYHFKARVRQVENRASPAYEACNNCGRAIARTAQGNNCIQCTDFNIHIIPRYRLAIMVEHDDIKARLTLFEEVATVYIGCTVNEYTMLLKQNNNQSQYHSVLENPDDGEHKFLFKLDKNVHAKNEILSIVVEGVEKPSPRCKREKVRGQKMTIKNGQEISATNEVSSVKAAGKPSPKYKKEQVLGETMTPKKEQYIDAIKQDVNCTVKTDSTTAYKKNGKEKKGMSHEDILATSLGENETLGSFMKRKRQILKKKETTKSTENDLQGVVKDAQQQKTVIEIKDDGKRHVSADKRQKAGVKKFGVSGVVRIKEEKM